MSCFHDHHHLYLKWNYNVLIMIIITGLNPIYYTSEKFVPSQQLFFPLQILEFFYNLYSSISYPRFTFFPSKKNPIWFWAKTRIKIFCNEVHPEILLYLYLKLDYNSEILISVGGSNPLNYTF